MIHVLQMTFLHDSELGELTKGVIVPEGGVKPYIHKVSKTVVWRYRLDQLQETNLKYSAVSSFLFDHYVQELLPPYPRDENQDGTADGNENAASTEEVSSS